MRIASFWKSSLAATALMGLVGTAAFAQEPSAEPSPEASAEPSSRPNAPVDGVLMEKGTKVPLSGVNVYLLPHKFKAITDEAGGFHFDAVPYGPYQLVVNMAGYERLDRKLEQHPPEGPTPSIRLYLERSDYLVYETTVYGKDKKRDDTTRSIGQKEFRQAGTGGDPIRAVQNLPGVNRAQSLGAQVIIQGSAPNQTRYLIDNHEVPIIFHFGGLSSVVMPEALERVDYLSAGYGPEYGRALGGLVNAWTRSPNRERFKGFGFVDTLNAGFQLEGPVGKDSSLMFSARHSYIGLFLGAVAGDDEDFNLTVAPEFRDVSTIYETRLSERDEFRFTAVASEDQLGFLLKEPVGRDPSVRGNFSNRTAFYRLIPQLIHRHSERAVSRWSLGFGHDSVKFDVGDDFFRLGNQQLTGRAELEFKHFAEWASFFGFDTRSRWASVDLKLPKFTGSGGVGNPISTGETQVQNIKVNYNDFGLYWRGQIQPAGTRWTIMPSIRGEYTNQTHQFMAMPRAALRYGIDESFFLRAAGGLYYQPPQEQETDAVLGNPSLKAPHAWHATFGVEKDFREGRAEGWTASAGAFYRRFEDLVINSNKLVQKNGAQAPENYNNDGDGRAFGGEALLRYNDRRWSAWIAYTISRSTRWNPTRAEYVFPYDQTHLLTALGNVDLRDNWRLSARMRYVTGNPFTPVIGGTFDADNDVYIPIRGAFYSERIDPFFQTDIRIDKKFIRDKMIWWVYLEVLNVTNRRNIEQIGYSYDYRQKETVSGLPIVPLLGVKGEF